MVILRFLTCKNSANALAVAKLVIGLLTKEHIDELMGLLRRIQTWRSAGSVAIRAGGAYVEPIDTGVGVVDRASEVEL